VFNITKLLDTPVTVRRVLWTTAPLLALAVALDILATFTPSGRTFVEEPSKEARK
jgi:hypothetical protein